MLYGFLFLVTVVVLSTVASAVHFVKNKRYIGGCILILVVAIPVTQLAVYVTKLKMDDHEWGFRKSLPIDAVEISEYRWADGFLPDYTYYLRAAISREEFEIYIKKYGLTVHKEDRVYQGYFDGPDWSREPATWWDPSHDETETYVDQPIPDEWTFAKYENGYLYLHSSNH